MIHVSGMDLKFSGGQRGNRTPDTRILNDMLQNFSLLVSRLNFQSSNVLWNVLSRLITQECMFSKQAAAMRIASFAKCSRATIRLTIEARRT